MTQPLTNPACSRSLARNLHLRQRPLLRLVPFSNRDLALRLLLSPQRRRLAKDTTISPEMGVAIIHRVAALRSAILDC